MNTHITYHAGAVENNGFAYLFVSPTRGGKSTLIAYLVERGFIFINDDYVSIDLDTYYVKPHIAPIHLRLDSITILKKNGCNIQGSYDNIGRMVYVPEVAAVNELPIGRIFFIKRSFTENQCTPLPKAESVQLLMQNLFYENDVNSQALRCAIDLADKCNLLVYSNLSYVADIMERTIYG